MGKLEGKVAIVTGAGRGIGRGIAIAMAREGAAVVVASRTPSTIEEVVGLITGEGGKALGFPCEVSEREELKALVDATVKTFGTVDILVNNAQGFNTRANPLGTMPVSPVEVLSEEEWEYTQATGPLATLRLMQFCFPFMKDRGGKVINLGSRRGQVGAENTAAYNSAKETIRGLSRTAAREWGRYGINVNIINPMVESNSMEALRQREPERVAASEAAIPMRRFGDPIRDAGALAVFLASSDSDYITGMTIMLDGGNHTYA